MKKTIKQKTLSLQSDLVFMISMLNTFKMSPLPLAVSHVK